MIPIDNEQIRLLEKRLRGVGVDRRTFLKIAGAAVAVTGTSSLLAACGGDDDDDDEPTAAPATATTGAAQATNTTATGGASPTAAASSPTAAAASPTTAVATATTAAATTPTTAATTEEQILYDGNQLINGDPASHDFNADLYCNGVGQIWGGLLTFDQDFLPVADWAETWEANDDASLWTFNIRPDNTGWQNGDPVTANDFVWGWRRLLLPETAGAYASILYDIKNSEDVNLNGADPTTLGVTAVDDWTLEVEMVGPRGLFPVIAGYVATVPSNQKTVEEFGAEYTDPAVVGGPVNSNGPFILMNWEHDVVCEVEKNPGYWKADEITLDKVVCKIIPSEQGILPYEANEVDWAVVPPADLPRVQTDSEMSAEVQKWVEPLIWKMLPAVNTEPFQLLEARQALSHSIDRDRINELTNGGGDPAYSLVPPGLFAYFGDDEEIRAIQAFDPQAAMDALAGTPYEGGQNWPSVTMILRDEQALGSQVMAEDVSAQVKENIGLDIALQVMDFQAFRDELFKNEYQLAWIRWYYDYPDPNNGYFDMFYSNKPSGKRQAWSNAEFDQLTIDGKEEADPDKRLEIYRQAEILMQSEVAYVPVVYRNAYDVYKPWVKGVPINRQGFTIPNGNIYVGMWNTMSIEGRPA